MTSDAPRLSISSDPDVRITVYDAVNRVVDKLAGIEHVQADTTRGLYRVHLDRCGFVSEHVIHHDAAEDRRFEAPELESPAPIAIARSSTSYAARAEDCSSRPDQLWLPAEQAAHGARLFVFVCRVGRDSHSVTVPSEPLSIHEAN